MRFIGQDTERAEKTIISHIVISLKVSNHHLHSKNTLKIIVAIYQSINRIISLYIIYKDCYLVITRLIRSCQTKAGSIMYFVLYTRSQKVVYLYSIFFWVQTFHAASSKSVMKLACSVCIRSINIITNNANNIRLIDFIWFLFW